MRDKGKNQKNIYFMSLTNVLERCLLLHIYMLIFISLLSTENHKKQKLKQPLSQNTKNICKYLNRKK